MAAAKTTTLAFRIEPGLKEAPRAAAAREHRSIANMVEVLTRDYGGRNDIFVTDQGGFSDNGQRSVKRRSALSPNK